jgi:hypothetical protein
MSKTYKREVALALLTGLGYVIYTGDHQMAEVLVWPVFTFAALSFGLDWWGKAGSVHRPFEPSRVQQHGPSELTDGGRPQRSSQYTDREDQQPRG